MLRFCFIILILTIPTFYLHGQDIALTVRDSETNFAIPIAKIEIGNHQYLSNYKGQLTLTFAGLAKITHPIYRDTTLQIDRTDSIIHLVKRSKKEIEKLFKKSDTLWKAYHQKPHDFIKELQFTTISKIESYRRERHIRTGWHLNKDYEPVFQNRINQDDKVYYKPLEIKNILSDSLDSELLSYKMPDFFIDQNYYVLPKIKIPNPLYENAPTQFDFYYAGSFQNYSLEVAILKGKLLQPDLFCLIMYVNDGEDVFHLSYYPESNYRLNYSFSFRFLPEIRIPEKTYQEAYTPLNPDFKSDTKIIFDSHNFNFYRHTKTDDLQKLNLTFFKNSLTDTTWQDDDLLEAKKNNLQLLDKNEKPGKYTFDDWMRLALNFYDNRLAIDLKYVYLNNVFAFNKFEFVRLGLGVQTKQELTEPFSFGVYWGYGLKDQLTKYGFNVGINQQSTNQNQFQISYTNDLYEPGKITYLNQPEDLIRNIFTSRMDRYRSFKPEWKYHVNNQIQTKLYLNRFKLTSLSDYRFSTTEDPTDLLDVFHANELGLQLKIGKVPTISNSVNNLLFLHKKFFYSASFNLANGLRFDNSDDLKYFKLNGNFNFVFKPLIRNRIELIWDFGILNTALPYQLMFLAPGNDSSLSSIIFRNSFQTIPLYEYISDRYTNFFYLHSFSIGKPNKAKMSPELGLAFNIGYGLLSSDLNNHHNVELTDYREGIWETGLQFNNVARIKFYKYFYLGLGLGIYYGQDNKLDSGSWAFRLTYKVASI